MTVLSRLELNTRHLAVLRDLGDVVHMHRSIMRAFPQEDSASPRASLGVLFRVEPGQQRVLVQSRATPDWWRLPGGYLHTVESKNIDGALAAIGPNRVLRFLLVANPSRKVAAAAPGTEPPRNSRRVELRSDDARHQWLVRRGERDGFELAGAGVHCGVRIDAAPVHSERTRRADRVTVKPVRFEGRLRVLDLDRFVRSLRDGIGPGKAYGCGLLSVAPG